MNIKGTDGSAKSDKTLPSVPPSPVTRVVETLSKVDTTSKDAQLNKTTISDNNGGRIEMNDDTRKTSILGSDFLNKKW